MTEPRGGSAAASLPLLLDDLTVLDLAGESGLYCGKLLADLGARVIRVEPPGGDPLRRRPPFAPGSESLFYLHYNTNKRSITLDLAQPAGRRLLRQLSRTADVLIETFAPGYLAGLGLGRAALARRNPGLVVASITPFGQRGAYRRFTGADIVASAMGGMMWLSGFPEDPPNLPGGLQAFHYASTIAAAGIMVAIQGRGRGPVTRGAHLDISIEECVAMSTLQTANANYYTWHRQVPGRRGGASGEGRSLFACQDGWISMVIPPYFWGSLLGWLREEGVAGDLVEDDLVDMPARQQHTAAIAAAEAALCARHTRAELMHEGQARRLLCVPVNAVDDLVHDPQLAARGYFLSVPGSDGHRRTYPGHPYHLEGVELGEFVEAAPPGGDNEAIYGGELGLSTARVAALRREAVI